MCEITFIITEHTASHQSIAWRYRARGPACRPGPQEECSPSMSFSLPRAWASMLLSPQYCLTCLLRTLEPVVLRTLIDLGRGAHNIIVLSVSSWIKKTLKEMSWFGVLNKENVANAMVILACTLWVFLRIFGVYARAITTTTTTTSSTTTTATTSSTTTTAPATATTTTTTTTTAATTATMSRLPSTDWSHKVTVIKCLANHPRQF